MNGHLKPKPRVPRIAKAPEAWSRGACIKPCSTTNEDRIEILDRRTPDEAYFAVQTIAAAPR